MKKVMAGLLALLLIASLTVPCVAAKVQRSNQKTTVDGIAVSCEVYNIDGSNYYKLRDLAHLLNGTSAQFSVSWNASTNTVDVYLSEPYEDVGGELVIGADKSATAKPTTQTIRIQERPVTGVSIYNIGGSNYIRLRDLNEKLGFTVDYNAVANIVAIQSEFFGCVDC